MDRRSFLTRILGGAAALAVLPKIELIASALPDVPGGEARAWFATFAKVHDEAWLLYKANMSRHGLPFDPAFYFPGCAQLGVVLPSGEMAKYWRTVAMGRELGTERVLMPAMAMLAQDMADHGIDRYGVPILPQAVDYAGTRGPLRMVAFYDAIENEYHVRFDVMGGSSEGAQRVVRRNQQARLKARIRARLEAKGIRIPERTV